MSQTAWYDTRWGRVFYWGIFGLTLIAVGLSMGVVDLKMQIPVVVYLFGFLGATVYAFTSFAKRFDADDRYRLKILSRTVAVFPLAAGVFLLGFAFPGVTGDLSALNATTTNGPDVTRGDRALAGLVFLAGIYVSATLHALGSLAERLLGYSQRRDRGTQEERED